MGSMDACGGRRPPIYVVEEQANPSTDYFVLPTLRDTGCRVVSCSGKDVPGLEELTGATVIFVRYVPARWMRAIESVRRLLGALVFFMDDDVLDIGASVGTPWRYRYKLARFAAFRKGWLRRQNAQLWVSTPYLYAKYAGWKPTLVLPSPLPGRTVRRVFYHGTASHMAEIRWLRPVLVEVLRRDENVFFEVTGGNDVYRLYRDVPRVTVVHPMKWPCYQHFLLAAERHIGLVPLLDLPFNKARSYTRLFDLTRCGAVGVYGKTAAYEGIVNDGVEGRLLAMEPETWVNAILELARDEAQRLTMLRNAKARIGRLADAASHTRAQFTPFPAQVPSLKVFP